MFLTLSVEHNSMCCDEPSQVRGHEKQYCKASKQSVAVPSLGLISLHLFHSQPWDWGFVFQVNCTCCHIYFHLSFLSIV